MGTGIGRWVEIIIQKKIIQWEQHLNIFSNNNNKMKESHSNQNSIIPQIQNNNNRKWKNNSYWNSKNNDYKSWWENRIHDYSNYDNKMEEYRANHGKSTQSHRDAENQRFYWEISNKSHTGLLCLAWEIAALLAYRDRI